MNLPISFFKFSEEVVWRCYVEKVLRNFEKTTRKHLCQKLFFDAVAFLRPPTLLKKRLWLRCFPVNLAKFLSTDFFTEHLRWLLLSFDDGHLISTPQVSRLCSFVTIESRDAARKGCDSDKSHS